MTDNEIIGALECRIDNFSKSVLDLINSQKADIDKWRNAFMGECMLSARSVKKELQSEAIEEFAKRLKRYSFVDNLSLDGKETVYVDDIDNLVKEMTEVQENGNK